MNQIQQDFEAYFKWCEDISGEVDYSLIEAETGFKYWEAAYFTYSQDNQKYIDLLRDLYYTHGYELPSGSFQKIEKLLGDLL